MLARCRPNKVCSRTEQEWTVAFVQGTLVELCSLSEAYRAKAIDQVQRIALYRTWFLSLVAGHEDIRKS